MAAKTDDPGAGRGYHHGDLRRHLIAVAERLLEERGVEGFTLRECARRAEVSPSAPAHHFGSASGLLTAVAALGFDGLAEAQEQALETAGAEPGARLRAIGGAYIRYAVAHPARFRVAFGDLPLDKADPALNEAGARAIGVLRRELEAARGGPSQPTGDPAFAAAMALTWSAVHGYARLLIDGRFEVVDPTLDRDAFLGEIADRTLALLVRAFDGAG